MRLLAIFLAVAALPLAAQVPRTNLNVHRDPIRQDINEPTDMKSDHCFRQVLENPRIRVFKVDVAAGESTQLNAHRHDYVVLSLGKNDFEISGALNSFPMQLEDGNMQVLTGGWPHRIVNRAQASLRLVVVEVAQNIHPGRPICGLGGQACADGKFGATDSGKYSRSTLFETDTVKLARLELGPHGALPEYRYDTAHVLLALKDAQLIDESQNVEKNQIQLKAGDAVWYGPNIVHRLRNMDDQEVRLMTLELKVK